MGTIRLTLFCLFALLISREATSQTLNWDYVNIADDERLSSANPDMVIAPNGRIHICYWDRINDQLIYAFRDPGTAWSRENVDVSTANGYKSAIALDGSGTPHIAYLEDMNGYNQVRFATRTGANTWTVENIPGHPVREHWGQYGPSAPNNFTERIKPSIDLVIKASGDPQILFFDAYMETGAFPTCISSVAEYGWQLWQAYKTGSTWQIQSTQGEVSDKYGNCSGDTLPHGDRYGEYVSLIERHDGSLAAAAMSRWNNELLMLETSPTNTTSWTSRILDSLDRIRPTYTWARQWFCMEGGSIYESEDSVIHFAVTTSLFYGENFCCTYPDPLAWGPWVTSMAYGRMDTSGISYYDFGSVRYRNFTSITGRGPDTTYVVWADLGPGYIMMMDTISSPDSLVNDTMFIDTVFQAAATSKSPVQVHGDTVNVLVYDDENEHLVLCKRHVDGGNWVHEIINESENYGASLDGTVEADISDTVAFLAFNDGYKGDLYYTEGAASGGWNFVIEQLDTSTHNFEAISYLRGPSGEPAILYGAGANQMLKLAVYSGGAWNYEIIDSSSYVSFSQIALDDDDSLHVAWYDANARCLKYAKRHFSGTNWSFDVVDCGTQPVGQYPSMKLGSDNAPRIAYFDELDQSLKMAKQDPVTRSWNIDTVYKDPPSAVGKFASLELTDTDLAKIAFLDEQRTAIYLAEENTVGLWQITLLDSTSAYSLGRPIDLEIDKFGNPWVAYNSFSNYDRINLMHRDSVWRVVSVSSQGRLANSFTFKVVDNDLFILGKKTQPQNTGVAMLYAGNGLFIAIDDAEKEPQPIAMQVFPNPMVQEASIYIEAKTPGRSTLTLHDLMGRKVQTLWDGKWIPAGKHVFPFQPNGVSEGIYIVEFSTNEGISTQKIFIAK